MEQEGILYTTKKVLNIAPDDTSFDFDLCIHINNAFSTLTDLGIGPPGGFVIDEGDADWSTYTAGWPEDPEDPDGTIKLNKVKTVVQLRTRLMFDPPTTSHHLEALKALLQENEWRLNVNRESYAWVDPAPVVVVQED